MNSCFVCNEEDHHGNCHPCTENATVSGKAIINVVLDVLANLRDQVLDISSCTVCQNCFDIIDEIDAFEFSLKQAKLRLKQKNVPRIVPKSESLKSLPFEIDQDNPILIDRLLTKPKNQKDFHADFESDLQAIYHETPENIDSKEISDAWTISLFKAESDTLELNIPGELKCFHCCDKSFNSVLDRMHHLAEKTAISCCQMTFSSEQEAFEHSSNNHFEFKDVFREPKILQNSYQCENCQLIFKEEIMYWFHFYLRHPKYSKIEFCQKCQIPINNLANYKRHYLIHHCEYIFQCPICPVIYQDLDCADKLLHHIRTCHAKTDSEFQTPKKSIYVSKTLARSYRQEPLTSLEYFKANMDISLYPPPDLTKVITSFNEVSEELKNECIETIESLRKMPYKISSIEDQIKWDLIMFKCSLSSYSFGIPGECQCFECSKTFNSVLDRISHNFSFHSVDKSFKCSLCPEELQSFAENCHLVKHLTKKHQITFPTKPSILAQYEILPDQSYKCGQCPGIFSNEAAFHFHQSETHKPSSLQCQICGKSASNLMDFKRHILIIHGGYTHACIICGKRYGSRDSIAAHLRAHLSKNIPKSTEKPTKSQPQKCLECGWISKSRLLHDRHLLATHGIQVEQKCPFCQEILPDPKALVEHKRSLHSNDICYICAKSFLTLSDLNLHISRMHPEMANLGSEAGKESAKHKPIKITRDKKEKTMCEVCSKMVLSHNIKLHMKNHQEKTLACPKCPRTFRWNSSLTSHLNSAHGDTVKTVTLSCEFCNKQFKDKSNLRQHRYSHTGGPYSCKTCGRGFARKDLLKSHMTKCAHVFQ